MSTHSFHSLTSLAEDGCHGQRTRQSSLSKKNPCIQKTRHGNCDVMGIHFSTGSALKKPLCTEIVVSTTMTMVMTKLVQNKWPMSKRCWNVLLFLAQTPVPADPDQHWQRANRNHRGHIADQAWQRLAMFASWKHCSICSLVLCLSLPARY